MKDSAYGLLLEGSVLCVCACRGLQPDKGVGCKGRRKEKQDPQQGNWAELLGACLSLLSILSELLLNARCFASCREIQISRGDMPFSPKLTSTHNCEDNCGSPTEVSVIEEAGPLRRMRGFGRAD